MRGSIGSMSQLGPAGAPRAMLLVMALAFGLLGASRPMPGRAATPAIAAAAPVVKLIASFSPNRLGQGTTIRLGYKVTPSPSQGPVAVTAMRLFLPAGLGVASSDLGLDTCYLPQLEQLGLAACPTNSLMGHGSALTEVPFGSSFVTEKVRIALFSGPLQNGHPQLLFNASGNFPVIADVVFSALVLPDGARFGSVIDAALPLVPGVPEGPYVALTELQTTIGPAGITYYETVKGRRVGFHPRGIVLPRRCPRGGFPFAVSLSFEGGLRAEAKTAVPCPRGRAARSAGHRSRRSHRS